MKIELKPVSRRRALAAMAALAFASVLAASGCGDSGKSGGGGTGSTGQAAGDANPKKLVFGFVPSVEADKIAENAEPMAAYLSQKLGMPVETFTSTGYTGLIEAMQAGKVDIGSLPPLGYVLARDQNAADAMLKTKRKGALTYHSMFVARADSGIKSIEDAKGKRIAFVDPASTSGYLFPAAYLKGKNINPQDNSFFAQTVFAGGHDSAVRSVYTGDVDVAAVYDDARNKLEKLPAYKDVKTKVVKIGQTDEIPNDTISVRTGLDPALVARIKDALIEYAHTPEGKKTLDEVYEVDDLVPAEDADYDPVRKVARAMDVNIKEVIDRPKASPSPAASASPSVAAAAKK
jgi:phosphonate transport system substrate-binding protein